MHQKIRLSWCRIAAIICVIAAGGLAVHATVLHRHSQPEPVVPAAAAPTSSAPTASMSLLPSDVQKALTSLCSPCTFADSGAPWNATDVVASGLPQRRLVRTERRGPTWLVQYQHGGIAKHSHTTVFSPKPSIHLVQGSSCMPPLEKCEW